MKNIFFVYIFLVPHFVKADEIQIVERTKLTTTITEAIGNSPMQGVTNNEVKKVEKSTFNRAVKSAIKELEEAMTDTCAIEMTVALKVDVKGTWKIIEAGIGGDIQVKIQNPKKGTHCSKT